MRIFKEQGGKMIADSNILARIYSYEQLKAEIEPYEKELKEELIEAINNGKNFEEIILSDKISFSYTSPSTKKILNQKKLKEDMPEVYEKYATTSNVKGSIKLSFK